MYLVSITLWVLVSGWYMLPRVQTIYVRLQWGNVVLTLAEPNVRYGFLCGRESYREECEEEPRRVRERVATDFLELITLPDARSGHYRFDRSTTSKSTSVCSHDTLRRR
jgi:hypothetical protein